MKDYLIDNFKLLLEGKITETEFINGLAISATPKEMAEWIYLRLMKEAEIGTQPIVITQREFKKLLSIFKIKGVRGFKPNGEIIPENRGSQENRPDTLF